MKYALIGLALIIGIGVGGLYYLGHLSQSGSAAGLVDGVLSSCPSSPNCVSSETHATGEQAVEPLPAAVWDQIPAAIASMGGSVRKSESNYLAAEFTSQRFGFVDDLELRLAADAVHVRSASRVGYSDGGANRERVAALRAQIEAR